MLPQDSTDCVFPRTLWHFQGSWNDVIAPHPVSEVICDVSREQDSEVEDTTAQTYHRSLYEKMLSAISPSLRNSELLSEELFFSQSKTLSASSDDPYATLHKVFRIVEHLSPTLHNIYKDVCTVNEINNVSKSCLSLLQTLDSSPRLEASLIVVSDAFANGEVWASSRSLRCEFLNIVSQHFTSFSSSPVDVLCALHFRYLTQTIAFGAEKPFQCKTYFSSSTEPNSSVSKPTTLSADVLSLAATLPPAAVQYLKQSEIENMNSMTSRQECVEENFKSTMIFSRRAIDRFTQDLQQCSRHPMLINEDDLQCTEDITPGNVESILTV